MIHRNLSPKRRSRRGRVFPVIGYVSAIGVCVCFLWAGASIVFNSLIGNDYGSTLKPQGPKSKAQEMAQKTVTAVSSADHSHFMEVLSHILVPRVVGTASHLKVKEYIKSQLKSSGWSVTSDIFSDHTPNFGELIFENIIAKLNPSATQVVVLACHYDSKYFPNMEFLGATDSAVPCAMLLNLAHCLQEELKHLKDSDVSLELWFFDGEEAFVQWGPYDSLYGARHLAQKMEDEKTLSQIKCLMLLDLLGAPNPVMYDFYNEKEIYKHLVTSEKALRRGGYLKNDKSVENAIFKNQLLFGHSVEDDHTPFLQRNVPVVHIIPSQFPDVWHTYKDNFGAIHMDTVEDLNKILRLFVLKFFNL